MITLVLTVVAWVLFWASALTGSDPETDFGVVMPLRVDDWHLLTAGWTSASLTGLLLCTLAAGALAYPAERVLGERRYLAVIAAMAFVVTPATLVVARGIEETGLNRWGNDLISEVFVSPIGWIFGVAAVGAGAMPQLWRRRVTALLVALSTTLVLFAGSLAEVVALGCTLAGVGISVAFRRSAPGPAVSLRERRMLVTLVLAAVAVGPIISGTTTLGMSPLSAIGALTWWPEISLHLTHGSCLFSDAEQQCLTALDVAEHAGLGQSIGNLTPMLVQLAIFVGLIRGRRGAWWWAVAFQLAAMVGLTLEIALGLEYYDFTFLYSVNLIAVVLPWIVCLAILLMTRRLFDVRVDHRGTRSFAIAVALGLLVSAALWWFAFGNGQWAQWLPRFLPPMVASVLPNPLVPDHGLEWVAFDWVGPVFWLIFSVALCRFLIRTPNESHEAKRRRAREILASGSGDHLQQMTVWDGNQYWFAAEQRGYVAYRLYRGIVVTVGEPVVGPGGAVAADIAAEFEAFVAQQGWQVAWYSVRGEFAERGYKKVHVAEESILSTQDVEFKGKRFQNIRTARNRAGKEGVRVEWSTWADLGITGREKIYTLSEEWVGDKALPEMGFTLGTVSELSDPDTLLGLAVGSDGHLHGVTSWLPVRENGRIVGLTLDFMRRDAHGFRPVIEFLLAEALVHADSLGYDWISLSGAPLAGSPADSLLDATLDKVGATMEPLYGFRSLAASKNKFHPTHEGWYLAYPDELALPAIGLAIAHAYLPRMKIKDAYRALQLLREARSAESVE